MGVKFGDAVAIVVAIGVVAFVSGRAFGSPGETPVVEIRAQNTQWIYPLDVEVTFQPGDRSGSCVIEIADGSVRVTESDCPLKICISTGTISADGQWIACLPHQTFIRIAGAPGANTVDGQTY